MDLTAVLRTVDALREAHDGEGFVLLAVSVVDSLLQVFAADEISLNDHHASVEQFSTLGLWPTRAAGEPCGASSTMPPGIPTYPDAQCAGQHSGEVMINGDPYGDGQWSSAVACTDSAGPASHGHALVVPLPAPEGIARTLVFSRHRPFGEEDRTAAVLLQPHIADALRYQGRRAAARVLTGRQRELLRLVAAGHDNIAIARKLGLSPCTVRKHLENAFARLDVSTRTAAVAKVCPDATWLCPVAAAPQSAFQHTPTAQRPGRPYGHCAGQK